jgi:hypothetical protein
VTLVPNAGAAQQAGGPCRDDTAGDDRVDATSLSRDSGESQRFSPESSPESESVNASVQQVERVGGVVHVVDAVPGFEHQTKERTGTGR